MPKRATGHVRWVNGVAITRIRITANERVSFAMPTCIDDEQAQERSRLLADVATRLRSASVPPEQVKAGLQLVAGAAPRSLRNALAMVDEIAGGEVATAAAPAAPTFQEIGEQWTKGELAQRHPDQIKRKRSADDDESRLRIHVYPVIGSLPIDRITLDHCEEVMRRLPATLAVATRRNVGQLVTRIMAMAVYPLRLIERSPIPRGFLPTASRTKALAYLYPDEDRRLMACAAVPLEYRLLWGFLAREGMREGEALSLTWADVDLDRGLVRIDKNKTDDPRAWPLSAGVAEALRRFRRQHRPASKPSEPVFLDPAGRAFTASGALGLPSLLRAHLVEIGLHRERPELFTTTAERRRIRVHDLRGTFVTIALANGRSESWISDRTGHKSSVMIARYKRTARTFAELRTGELEPLFQAIPELSIGHGMATTAVDPSFSSEKLASPAGFEPASPT